MDGRSRQCMCSSVGVGGGSTRTRRSMLPLVQGTCMPPRAQIFYLSPLRCQPPGGACVLRCAVPAALRSGSSLGG